MVGRPGSGVVLWLAEEAVSSRSQMIEFSLRLHQEVVKEVKEGSMEERAVRLQMNGVVELD